MFQSRARNATATASPVRIKGVARVRVSLSANQEPRLRHRHLAVGAGELGTGQRQRHGRQRHRRRDRQRPVPRRLQPGGGMGARLKPHGSSCPVISRPSSRTVTPEVGIVALSRPRCITATRSERRKQLLQVLGDQHDARTAPAGVEQARVDERHGTDVEPAGRLVGEDQARRQLEHAAEQQLLHVAAGEQADPLARPLAAHVVGRDQLPRHAAASRPRRSKPRRWKVGRR